MVDFQDTSPGNRTTALLPLGRGLCTNAVLMSSEVRSYPSVAASVNMIRKDSPEGVLLEIPWLAAEELPLAISCTTSLHLTPSSFSISFGLTIQRVPKILIPCSFAYFSASDFVITDPNRTWFKDPQAPPVYRSPFSLYPRYVLNLRRLR